MEFNFNEQAKQHEKEAGIGGDYFKFKEGQNRIRVVSPSIRHISSYKGIVNTKFLTYIIDRVDQQVKLAFLPYTIIKMIGDLQMSPDYSFTQVPMPYDITINATKAGTKEVSYSVVPARENTELTEAEKEVISKQKDLKEVEKQMSEKNPIQVDEQEPPREEFPTP